MVFIELASCDLHGYNYIKGSFYTMTIPSFQKKMAKTVRIIRPYGNFGEVLCIMAYTGGWWGRGAALQNGVPLQASGI